jgi:hypothetical protein
MLDKSIRSLIRPFRLSTQRTKSLLWLPVSLRTGADLVGQTYNLVVFFI